MPQSAILFIQTGALSSVRYAIRGYCTRAIECVLSLLESSVDLIRSFEHVTRTIGFELRRRAARLRLYIVTLYVCALRSKIGTVALSGLQTGGHGLLLLCLFPVTSGIGGAPILLLLLPPGFHLPHIRFCIALL